jgi:hypothetical protein
LGTEKIEEGGDQKWGNVGVGERLSCSKPDCQEGWVHGYQMEVDPAFDLW